jgi:hypothetical protein
LKLFDSNWSRFIKQPLFTQSTKATRNWLIQILSKAFPFATPALNIRIASIAIDATSTHGIFLKVEDFRIWHPIQNLPHRPNCCTLWADQGPNPPSSLGGHAAKVLKTTDRMFCD